MTGTRSVFVFLTHSGPVYTNPSFTKLSQSQTVTGTERFLFQQMQHSFYMYSKQMYSEDVTISQQADSKEGI